MPNTMKKLRNIFLAGLVVVLYSSSLMAQGDIITAADFMKLYKTDKSLVTIDAAKADSYKKSHIKNAVNIPNVNLNNNKDDGFLISNEELATIFHFPGRGVAAAPFVPRVESKKGEAPPGLPTE